MSEHSGPAEVVLADILDLSVAGPLTAELAALRGRPVDLNAASVERMGALCLQVLLSARLTWAADGAPFNVVNPSTAFTEQLARFGAAPFTS